MAEQQVSPAYAAFSIIKRPEEKEDVNMPMNAADALILFLKTGQMEAATCCKQSLDTVLKVLQEGPDGKSQVNIGHAAICWRCGCTGIPKNFPSMENDVEHIIKSYSISPVCKSCESDDTNFIQCCQPDGSKLPWIELSVPSAI